MCQQYARNARLPLALALVIVVVSPSRLDQSLPLFHLQFDVDALFLQKLPLGIVPVLWLPLLLSRSAALSLQPGLLGVVEAEHVVLAHDDAIPCHRWRVRC